MARRTKKKKRRSFPPAASSGPAVGPKDKPLAKTKPKAPGQPVRETVESLAIAFVLAFLFRTFQAEAFVIPTGSMAPTLMGRHKDVRCDECEQRFRVNASAEGDEIAKLRRRFAETTSDSEIRRRVQTIGGLCSSCRYSMPLRADLPRGTRRPGRKPTDAGTYSGDRILVNKYLYQFQEPQRWDVVVFKFPGNASQNYIKRLVGLPNEDLRIYQGDLFIRPAGVDRPYQLAPRPVSKLLAMRQLVHDSDRESTRLLRAGWPNRWRGEAATDGAGWSVETQATGRRAASSFRVAASPETRWIRYRHTPPPEEAWPLTRAAGSEADGQLAANAASPRLITDFNAYNTDISWERVARQGGFSVEPINLGLHWVGDLYLDAWVERADAAGELTLELVEAGQHLRCVIDLATGDAALRIVRFGGGGVVEGFSPVARGAARGGGPMRLRFANVDDRLLLWVNGKLADFDEPTTYDVDAVFGGRNAIAPKTGAADAGDLAPAAVGARGAGVTISRLQVWRDLYYIADRWDTPLREEHPTGQFPVTDWELTGPPIAGEFRVPTDSGRAVITQIAGDPGLWSAFSRRRQVMFSTGADQFFVLGDNSAQSSDCRLWASGRFGGEPGGPYLERSLLIGKAICVYWPHSWFFLVPNVADMRLVR